MSVVPSHFITKTCNYKQNSRIFPRSRIKVVVLGRLWSIFKDFKPPIVVKWVNPQVYVKKKVELLLKKLRKAIRASKDNERVRSKFVM